MADTIGGENVSLAAKAIGGLGALNVGLEEFMDMNLLTEFLSTGTTEFQIAVGLVAGAGALVLLEAVEEVN